MAKKLSEYTTAELVEELRKREGVYAEIAEPYVTYGVEVGGVGLAGTGPAIILTVID